MLGKQLLVNWIADSFKHKQTSLAEPVFVYGEKTMANFVLACFRSVTKKDISDCRINDLPSRREAVAWSRSRSQRVKKDETAEKIRNFSLIKENEFISYDFQEILYYLMSGQVRRLMVAKDQSIFGKINKSTGEITYTHYHKDHEDDDLLDDIAQIAIEQGIDPIMAKRGQMRKQRLIKAVIEENSRHNPAASQEALGVA